MYGTNRCEETQRRPGEGRTAVVWRVVVHCHTGLASLCLQIGCHVAQAGLEFVMLPKDDFECLSDSLHLPSAVVTGVWTAFHWLLCEHLLSVTPFPSVVSQNVMDASCCLPASQSPECPLPSLFTEGRN